MTTRCHYQRGWRRPQVLRPSGGGLCSEVQYIMGNGHMRTPTVNRHLWKDYLPATPLTVSAISDCYGSFTLHGNGTRNSIGNNGFIYYAMYWTHYTETGTGNRNGDQWVAYPFPCSWSCSLSHSHSQSHTTWCGMIAISDTKTISTSRQIKSLSLYPGKRDND